MHPDDSKSYSNAGSEMFFLKWRWKQKHHKGKRPRVKNQFNNLWPPRSPIRNPCYFWLLRHLKSLMYHGGVATLNDLNSSIWKHHNWSVTICCWIHCPSTWSFASEWGWSHGSLFPTSSWTQLTTSLLVNFILIYFYFCKLNFFSQRTYYYFLLTFI